MNIGEVILMMGFFCAILLILLLHLCMKYSDIQYWQYYHFCIWLKLFRLFSEQTGYLVLAEILFGLKRVCFGDF